MCPMPSNPIPFVLRGVKAEFGLDTTYTMNYWACCESFSFIGDSHSQINYNLSSKELAIKNKKGETILHAESTDSLFGKFYANDVREDGFSWNYMPYKFSRVNN